VCPVPFHSTVQLRVLLSSAGNEVGEKNSRAGVTVWPYGQDYVLGRSDPGLAGLHALRVPAIRPPLIRSCKISAGCETTLASFGIAWRTRAEDVMLPECGKRGFGHLAIEGSCERRSRN
jgi:hypothetical protein